MDWKMPTLVGGVLTILAAATAAGQILKRQPDAGLNSAAVQTFNLRMRAWWLMCSLLAAAMLLGNTATVILFGLISFWALREFITLTPTRLGDHRALFWVFFAFTPAQFVMVGLQYYEVYSVLIPVYAFLFILARVAFSGDYKRFLERTAKIQAGLLICVYCLSHAPALMYLPAKRPDPGAGARLLFFFVLIVQLGDAMQYLAGKLFGRRVIAPTISPNKTWEGLLGGVGATTLLGTALYWATPFQVWQAAIMSLVITLMGFAGSITMSAIKRDRGVKDYGTLVEGHSGVLDRIDSICFAAPVCYHLSRLFLMS
ncbi:MAG TPA: phosphatidate cytidylyltransferase [Pirellulales bacterium]|jgi:phosphatidate cytidylyltransferase|nr:phosphatidate cytidylyltransferase [Pirellulales bacterium]